MPEPFTIEELKVFYRKHKSGFIPKVLCSEFRISEEYFVIAVHAGKWLIDKERYGRDKIQPLSIASVPEQAPVIPMVKSQKQFQRPPAEYSNRSPYGIASPGNNLSVNYFPNNYRIA